MTTPLDLAVQAKRQKCATLLLEHGAMQGKELAPP